MLANIPVYGLNAEVDDPETVPLLDERETMPETENMPETETMPETEIMPETETMPETEIMPETETETPLLDEDIPDPVSTKYRVRKGNYGANYVLGNHDGIRVHEQCDKDARVVEYIMPDGQFEVKGVDKGKGRTWGNNIILENGEVKPPSWCVKINEKGNKLRPSLTKKLKTGF